ncbi:hypothetical protein [Jiangella endophytica]|uniref:hypothetical protein n=1 Tax=Jiangella endophytica TaxID=1623398 RepID=UPI000E34485E|nr:hypothetical protein [Jiangella endophytica]
MEVLRIAAVQDGLITRSQALAAGMSIGALRHAARPGGPWRRVVPGVYATFTGPLQDLHRLRTAELIIGPEGMITGSWACRWWGLRYGPDPGERVDVLLDHRHDRGKVGAVRVIRTSRLPAPRRCVDVGALEELRRSGPPLDLVLDGTVVSAGVVTLAPPACAVVDALVHARQPVYLRDARALMCEVVQRRRATVAELRAEVAAAPRRGGAMTRLAMKDIDAGCRSAPECELRDLVLMSSVLPEPRWNRVLPGHRGIVPDACWPRARLVVEVDSRSYHGFGDAPRRTEERRARYAALGWRMLPVSPARLRSEPQAVLREIEVAYLAGG